MCLLVRVLALAGKLTHEHDDYMGKSLTLLSVMGSLNWVLGEQLRQVTVSIGLHGHREHRWGHNAITMHKQMDMHKYKFIASLFPLPLSDSDFTSPVRRVCKHNNSLTPR